jgi:hypothetical protein
MGTNSLTAIEGLERLLLLLHAAGEGHDRCPVGAGTPAPPCYRLGAERETGMAVEGILVWSGGGPESPAMAKGGFHSPWRVVGLVGGGRAETGSDRQRRWSADTPRLKHARCHQPSA